MNDIKDLTVWDKFNNQLREQQDFFNDMLPQNCSFEKFRGIIKSAIYKNPELLNADRTSLINSCRFAAQDGLLVDGRESALVTYKTKQKDGSYIQAVQYLPMVAGILKKIRNSGELSTLSAQVVYAHDEFDYCLGDDEYIKHKPAMSNRGKPICCYAIVKTKDGAVYREVMSIEDIEDVRKSSRGGDFGPWKTHYTEMMKKTVIRRLSKRLPMSSDLETTIKADDNLYDFSQQLENMEPPNRTALDILNEQITQQPIDIGNAQEVINE